MKRKALVYLVAAALVSILVGAGAVAYVLHHYIQGLEERAFDVAEQRTYLDRVVQDLAHVETLPFFTDIRKTQDLTDPALDAGPYLNVRLPWMTGDVEDGPHGGDLVLPTALTDQLTPGDRDWVSRVDELGPAAAKLDYSWMAALRPFQYWDLERVGPLGDWLAKHPKAMGFQYPGLRLQVLTQWCKLRLLAALRHGPGPEADAALADVRHLGALALTAPQLVYEMVGIQYLGLANRAAASLHAPQLPSKDDIDLVKRVVWALPGYLDESLTEAEAARIYPVQGPAPLGTCAALGEALGGAAMGRALLASSYPERYAARDRLFKRLEGSCRPQHAFALWNDPTYVPDVLQQDVFAATDDEPSRPPMKVTIQDLRNVPFLLRIYGLSLAGLAKPAFLKLYQTP